jgi:hypothetical protein
MALWICGNDIQKIIKIVICGKNSTENSYMCGATGRNRFEPQKDQNLMFLVTVF